MIPALYRRDNRALQGRIQDFEMGGWIFVIMSEKLNIISIFKDKKKRGGLKFTPFTSPGSAPALIVGTVMTRSKCSQLWQQALQHESTWKGIKGWLFKSTPCWFKVARITYNNLTRTTTSGSVCMTINTQSVTKACNGVNYLKVGTSYFSIKFIFQNRSINGIHKNVRFIFNLIRFTNRS